MKKLVIIVLVLLVAGLLGFFLVGGLGKNENNLGGNTVANSNLDKITLRVAIPCSGHAGLIIASLKSLSGVEKVEFKGSNIFDVYYDSEKVSKEQILGISIFKEYTAREI